MVMNYNKIVYIYIFNIEVSTILFRHFKPRSGGNGLAKNIQKMKKIHKNGKIGKIGVNCVHIDHNLCIYR